MAENINVSAVRPQAQQTSQARPQAETQDADKASRVEDPKATRPVEATRSAAEQAAISVVELQSAIDQLNQFMNDGQRSLAFSVDESAEQVVVQVRDKETDELVRQIPTPEALELKQHLQGVIGLLFNDKA